MDPLQSGLAAIGGQVLYTLGDVVGGDTAESLDSSASPKLPTGPSVPTASGSSIQPKPLVPAWVPYAVGGVLIIGAVAYFASRR
jgi:hypothetical protein